MRGLLVETAAAGELLVEEAASLAVVRLKPDPIQDDIFGHGLRPRVQVAALIVLLVDPRRTWLSKRVAISGAETGNRRVDRLRRVSTGLGTDRVLNVRLPLRPDVERSAEEGEVRHVVRRARIERIEWLFDGWHGAKVVCVRVSRIEIPSPIDAGLRVRR